MPQLSDLVEKRKFIKKKYRPWDLSGTNTIDGEETPTVAPETTTVSQPSTTPLIVRDEPAVYVISTPVNDISGNKTGNDSDNKQITNREQTDNIPVTKKSQTDNIYVTNREQTGNITDNVRGNAEGIAYLVESIKKLSGIQKTIFFHVLNLCSARGELDTGNILSGDLSHAANCSIGSAKTSLIRLIEKQLILRLQGKASRGGHMVLGITQEIQAAAISAQKALFNPFKQSQTDNVSDNITDNAVPYSSSINKNITTTSLPPEWKKINFELLQHIGFSETQLRQLYDSKMTDPQIVQDAIHRFGYSLHHNDKVKGYADPLNVLMGVLRKGQRWNEPNYVSPREFALQQMLDEKRKSKEQYDAMLKELLDLEFPEWRKKLSDNEIRQIVPADILKMKMSAATQAALRTFFMENILLPRLDHK